MRHFVISAGLAMLAAGACSPGAFETAEPEQPESSETRTPGITPGDPIPADGFEQSAPVDPAAAPAAGEPASGGG